MNQSCIRPDKPATPAQIRALAQAVKDAQQLANAESRSYLVTRGPGRERPFVTQFAGLESLAAIIAQAVAVGTTLVVPPQGMHAGLSGVEIMAAEIAARDRAMIDERLLLDAAFRARHLGQ